MNQLLDKKSIESLEPIAIAPEGSKCTKSSPTMTMHTNLNYDQHSSEEELEVINGPCSIAAVESAGNFLRTSALSLASDRESSSLEPEDLLGGGPSPDNFGSTKFEIRKRSLAHSSDDELRNLVEPVPTPVNFRASPPLEALKPNRNRQMYRSTTPLILTETSRGIENIKLSCDSGEQQSSNTKSSHINSNICDNHSTLTTKLNEKSSHYIHQPQPKYQFYHYKNNATSSTSALDLDVRSISPPAKLFHCAISPRRRPMRTHHAPQRLQRPHRPCLDFDKMQQVSLSSLQ